MVKQAAVLYKPRRNIEFSPVFLRYSNDSNKQSLRRQGIQLVLPHHSLMITIRIIVTLVAITRTCSNVRTVFIVLNKIV